MTRPEAEDDFAKSLAVAYAFIRARIAAGGPKGWADENYRPKKKTKAE